MGAAYAGSTTISAVAAIQQSAQVMRSSALQGIGEIASI